MRERRWESRGKLTFREVLALGDRLALLGLNPATAKKEIISYIEEWTVPFVHDFSRLDPWTTEDVTLVHIAEKWHGDFFLLTGGYHTVYLNDRHLLLGEPSLENPSGIGDSLPRRHVLGGISPGPRLCSRPPPHYRGGAAGRDPGGCAARALAGGTAPRVR